MAYDGGDDADREDNEKGRMNLEEGDESQRLSGAGSMSEGQVHSERQETESQGSETADPQPRSVPPLYASH